MRVRYLNSKVLITGCSGFVGQHFLEVEKNSSLDILSAVRKGSYKSSRDTVIVGDINANTDWSDALIDVDVVIHMAARAHIMNDADVDPLKAYREVNTEGALNLARQAAEKGIKRFVFVSSIKVNGESTTGMTSFTENNALAPQDPYGFSKAEAEDGLRTISEKTAMEVVIIRPPLVYGPGVKASFRNLMKLALSNLPLPFGAIHNARSMVYVGNLVDFISKCVVHPAAKNQTFIVSDGLDLSLCEMLTLMRSSMGKAVRLFSVPVYIFRFLGMLAGKRDVIDRLVGSLQVDSGKAKQLLDWKPPYSVEQGIKATVDSFLKGDK